METTEVYKGRLLRLAMFLKALPPERFNFNRWVGSYWRGAQDLSCGTTACGFGWATTIPEFQALGLRLFKRGDADMAHPRLNGDDTRDAWDATCIAASTIFGLTSEETELLFTPTEDPNDDVDSFWDEEEMEKYLLDADAEASDGRLSGRASPKRLAEHIESFVQYKYGE